jgi:hypothetical protein
VIELANSNGCVVRFVDEHRANEWRKKQPYPREWGRVNWGTVGPVQEDSK